VAAGDKTTAKVIIALLAEEVAAGDNTTARVITALPVGYLNWMVSAHVGL
jgi:hypothetical protein